MGEEEGATAPLTFPFLLASVEEEAESERRRWASSTLALSQWRRMFWRCSWLVWAESVKSCEEKKNKLD